MASIVQAAADFLSTDGQSSFSTGLVAAPTAGNLLVMPYGARDDDDSAKPTFALPGNWVKAVEIADMEFHSGGIGWKVADGTETGSLVITPGAQVDSSWAGVIEINEPGVSDWVLDTTAEDGSGATSVSSIASGTTGVLSSDVGVAIGIGTSRTGAEGLSTDTGSSTPLTTEDPSFKRDCGRCNFIAWFLSLTATTALNATISESTGSSRMGSAVAVFVPAGAPSPSKLLGRSVDIDFPTHKVLIESGV